MGQIDAGIRIVSETPLQGPTEETPDVAMFCYSVGLYGASHPYQYQGSPVLARHTLALAESVLSWVTCIGIE